jgi:hypothetical protein
MPTPTFETLETLPTAELTNVTGGMDAGAIGGQIGGLVDSFTGGKGEGAQMGGKIGNLVQSFLGSGGGGGGE